MSRLTYYVYYRVQAGAAAGTRERVRAAQAELAAALHVPVQLFVKRGEPEVWMEVYEDVTDAIGFERALATAVERHRLLDGLRPGSTRHVECFTVAPECA